MTDRYYFDAYITADHDGEGWTLYEARTGHPLSDTLPTWEDAAFAAEIFGWTVPQETS